MKHKMETQKMPKMTKEKILTDFSKEALLSRNAVEETSGLERARTGGFQLCTLFPLFRFPTQLGVVFPGSGSVSFG